MKTLERSQNATAAMNWRHRNKEYIRQYDDIPHVKAKRAEWARNDRKKNPEKLRLVLKRSRSKHPEKSRARMAVAYASRRGLLVRGSCCVCNGDKYIEAHHEDYSKTLEVMWLCRSCHHKLRYMNIDEMKKRIGG